MGGLAAEGFGMGCHFCRGRIPARRTTLKRAHRVSDEAAGGAQANTHASNRAHAKTGGHGQCNDTHDERPASGRKSTHGGEAEGATPQKTWFCWLANRARLLPRELTESDGSANTCASWCT